MSSLVIPKNGVVLSGPSTTTSKSSETIPKPSQIMRLDLSEGMLNEVLKSFNNSGKGAHISFGESPTLHYGNETKLLTTSPSDNSNELYTYSSNKKEEFEFAGLISHKFTIKQSQERMAETDAALLKLQNSLASIEKNKQSKKTLFVPDNSKLLPSKGNKKHQSQASRTLIAKGNHRQLLNGATTRSVPSSPFLGSSRTIQPVTVEPKQSPTPNDTRLETLKALRFPLAHLLSIRPVSEKFLAQKTLSKVEDCREILSKIGRRARLDESKWDLTDRGYKELDVWKFNYASLEDRQAAIDHAVSAFDRLRLSREDKLWQMLLPMEERGKGKILSRLHLHAGPIQRISTPRINLQPSEEVNGGYGTANDSDGRNDRLAPNGAASMQRSCSQDPFKKTRVSQKEAQSKRLLSKNPQKRAQLTKVKDKKPMPKSDDKKEAKEESKVKSAEFVNDSDEDIDMEPAVTLQKSAKQTKELENGTEMQRQVENGGSGSSKPLTEAKLNSGEQQTTSLPSTTAEAKTSTIGSNNSRSPHQSSETNLSSASMKKSISRQRNTSSPHKPSPLGSSPPTNASDFDNKLASSSKASSSSSSPLITQIRNEANPPTRHSNTTPEIKELGQDSSKHTLKRKFGDLESEIHTFDVPASSSQTDSSKRHKSTTVTPNLSYISSSSLSPPSYAETIQLAVKFKAFYAKYAKLYREVSSSPEPAEESVLKVRKMHDRLAAMKADIERNAAAL